MLIILVVAMVVLGPERLPVMARKMGRWAAEFRRAATDLRRGLEAEVGEISQLKREVVDPVKAAVDDVKTPLAQARRDAEKPMMEMKGAVEGATGLAASLKPAPPSVDQASPSKPLRWIGPMAETPTVEVERETRLRWIGPVAEQGPTPEDAAADLASIEATGEALVDHPEQSGAETS